jgi:hypothetical protein
LISTAAFVFNGSMKAGLRISVKDYSTGKNLEVLLYRLPLQSKRPAARVAEL